MKDALRPELRYQVGQARGISDIAELEFASGPPTLWFDNIDA
jgi:hypothetical protein